jgi:hypothetical protein
VHQHLACRVKLDRFQFKAEVSAGARTPAIPGYRVVSDSLVRSQTTIKTYARVREYVNSITGTRIFLQHQPLLPGLSPFKATVIGYDCRRLSRREIQQIVRAFRSYQLLLVEVAWDFSPRSGVDIEFVLRHGVFGKSHPHSSRLFADRALYGSRKTGKLVRCYRKKELDAFRVEVEVHSSWLRRYGIVTILDVWKLPASLFPKHIRFVNVNWMALRKHLSRRGLSSGHIIQQAKDRSDSIHAVMELLRNSGVHNPHRFLLTVAPSREIFQSLKNWARTF